MCRLQNIAMRDYQESVTTGQTNRRPKCVMLRRRHNNMCISVVGWLVVLRIYVTLAVFQPYRDLEAGDNQSLKFKWRGGESNPAPLAPQAKSLTTRPPPLHWCDSYTSNPSRQKFPIRRHIFCISIMYLFIIFGSYPSTLVLLYIGLAVFNELVNQSVVAEHNTGHLLYVCSAFRIVYNVHVFNKAGNDMAVTKFQATAFFNLKNNVLQPSCTYLEKQMKICCK